MACVWMIFGVGFYSYTIGNMTSIIESLDSEKSEVQGKLDTLKKFQSNTKMSVNLYNRIKRHVENNAM